VEKMKNKDPTSIKKLMEAGQEIILLNADGEDPTYRALVQLPGWVDYPEEEFDFSLEYTPEAISKAMKTFIGHNIADTSGKPDPHDRTTDDEFAEIVNSGFCPAYGGYIDFKIFKSEYHPVIKNILDRIQNGRPVKKGFSTEPRIKKVLKKGEKKFQIQDMAYEGIVFTDMGKTRQDGTGICGIVLNAIPDEIKGENMAEMIEKSKYDELMNKNLELERDIAKLTIDHQKLQSDFKSGKTKYDELVTEKQQSDQKVTDMEDKLKTFLKNQKLAKEQKINELLENIPEDQQETMKGIYEEMDLNQLEAVGITVNNAIKEPEDPKKKKGVIVKNGKKTKAKDGQEPLSDDEEYIMGLVNRYRHPSMNK
jgi:hypothetical protein